LLPFFVLHQPIIIVIAYFIVQLSWSIPVKMIAVVTASLLVVLGFCQFVIIPIRPLHPLLGMKSPDRRTAEASEGQDLA
jgi:glucan biosynthesis protein C